MAATQSNYGRSLAASLAGLIVALSVIIWKSDFVHPPPTTGIAVLPFENLGDNKERHIRRRWHPGRYFNQAGEDCRS